MTDKDLAGMTLEELTQLIDQRIRQLVWQRTDRRPMREVRASVRRNRIVPPPGARSALEMLREDRDA